MWGVDSVLVGVIDIVSRFILQLQVQRFDLIQCIGEGKKLVGVLPSLARRLSSCVTFPNEIDCLFGACMLSHETGGALAHRGVVTEPVFKMDILCSGS